MSQEIEVKIKRGEVQIAKSSDDQVHIDASPEVTIRHEGDRYRVECDRSDPVEVTLRLPEMVHELDVNVGRGLLSGEGFAVARGDFNVGLGKMDLHTLSGSFDLNVGKGNLALRDISGTIDANAGMGHLVGQKLRGTFDINAGLGNVTLTDSGGTFDVNAGKGDVNLDGQSGRMEVNCGMGALAIASSRQLSLEANCGLGKVRVEGGRLEEANISVGLASVTVDASVGQLTIDVKTRGNIDLMAPSDEGARVDASTDRGRIISHLDLVAVNNPGPQRGQRLVGTWGDGRGTISLHTRRGTITLAHGPSTVRAQGAPAVVLHDEAPAPGEKNDSQLILERLHQGELTVEEAEALLDITDKPTP